MPSPRREELIRALPYARRYARALSGSQERGDDLVTESLRELLTAADSDDDVRVALYGAITRRHETRRAGLPLVSGLTQQQRSLLLLTSLVGLEVATAGTMLHDARDRLRAAAATSVLIIEDEPIIAMDIEELVANCGHRVVGVAATEKDAVEIAERERPGLILADINLGAGGDGSSAVSRILAVHHVPVIFVTAYPERLLTGEALEPAFVITKPFEPLTLAIATYQAVTGGVQLD
jgi:CheY-like chemotaxis protein/DNA-directed RNA polymerase specialized sigma24 family protein